MTGIAKNTIVLFESNKVLIYPNDNAPKSEPILLIDPIHEVCSFVNGPDRSGVSSDVNIGNAGEVQLLINKMMTICDDCLYCQNSNSKLIVLGCVPPCLEL